MTSIRISSYSRFPGPRFRTEGEHSGEEFRDDILLPAFRAAAAASQRLIVDFDGVAFGYPTSFLEEAFGGLARQMGVQAVLDVLDLHSTQDPNLAAEVTRYIKDAFLTSRERAQIPSTSHA